MVSAWSAAARPRAARVGRWLPPRLRDDLDRDVDLLKVEIEGTAVDMIPDCTERIGWGRPFCAEYHSLRERERRFIQPPENIGMDLQLDVFANRT
jgi:hypothetical protein